VSPHARPTRSKSRMIRRYFTLIVLFAMLLGAGVGFVIHSAYSPDQWAGIAGGFSIVTDIFLRLIRMIIAPLVITTLVVGIAHMGGSSTLGRVGARTLGWFVVASIVSLLMGLGLVHLLQPGAGIALPSPSAGADAGVKAGALNLKDFVTHLVPRSIFEAMAN